jgi:hypothetical protein
MSIIMDIQEAVTQGRSIRNLYARLRITRDTRERADLLRQARQCVDTLMQQLPRLAQDAAASGPDEDTRAALGTLSEVMEQVMVQEREYRVSAGASPDEMDIATEPTRS